MSFLDRVREKLKNSSRQRFVEHFQGNDAQKVFAGLEVLAEDFAEFGEKLENIQQMQQGLITKRADVMPFSDPPLTEEGVGACSECGHMFKADLLKKTKTGQWCPECYAKKFPMAAKRGAK